MEMWILTIIVQTVSYIAAGFKLWNDMQTKTREMFTQMQIEQKEVMIRLNQVERQDDEIYKMLDRMMSELTAIKIMMQNKADR